MTHHMEYADPARGGTSAPHVVIAVLTYRRTDRLAPALRMLMALCREHPDASVLVVDNNLGADARPTVSAAADGAPRGQLRYVHEPRPGIAAARNRAIDESSDAELLIFIDDDERPMAGWLSHLLQLHDEQRPAAIAGPVVSRFTQEPERWILAGGFFHRRRLPTGTRIECAATNNLLLDLAQIRALGIRFADEFGLTGGSDTLFTRQLTRRGATILWCDEAIVIDQVPAERMSRQWVLQKAFRYGNVTPRIELAMATSPTARLRARLSGFAGGVARLAAGIATILFGAVTATIGRRARGARLAARGAGMTLGSCGYSYVEYARNRRAGAPLRTIGSTSRPPVKTGGS